MKETTKWGSWQDLYLGPGVRVKLLTVARGHSLSMQHHLDRSELWLVIQGACMVHDRDGHGSICDTRVLNLHDHLHIPRGTWHKLTNPWSEDCHLIELQYGDSCREDDLVLCPQDQQQRSQEYAAYYQQQTQS